MSRESLEAAVDKEEFFKGWDRHWNQSPDNVSLYGVLWLEGPVFRGQERVGCSIVDFGDPDIFIEHAVKNVKAFLAGHEQRMGVTTSQTRIVGPLEGRQLSEELANDAKPL